MRRLILAACAALVSFYCYASDDSWFYFPAQNPYVAVTLASAQTQVAMGTDEYKNAVFGYLYIDGGAGGEAKVCSTSCTIQWMPGAITWANSATTLDIGIQDMDAATGPPAQPDGTFDVKATVTPAGGANPHTITANTWNTVTMTTGTKTMSTGDLIAIVWHLTNLGGADSVTTRIHGSGATVNMPQAITYNGSWVAGGGVPNALIVFDDGTRGWIQGSALWSATSAGTYVSTDNPDEKAIICQTDFDAIVIGMYGYISMTNGATATLTFYNDPLGTPTTPTGAQLSPNEAHMTASATTRTYAALIPTPFEIKANTPWAVGFAATNGTNVSVATDTVNAAADMASYSGGVNCYQGTRQNGTGAFTAGTTIRPHLGIIYRKVTAAGCRTFLRGGTCY